MTREGPNERPSGNLTSALRSMAGLLKGEFDSFQQVWEEKEAKAGHLPGRIHVIFATVSLPALGGRVFYVKLYPDA